MSYPAYTHAEATAREAFLALMWALSYPGRPQRLPANSPDAHDVFGAVAAALLDLETTFYTSDDVLAQKLAATAARAFPPERAAYHFYPTVNSAALTSLASAPVGSMLYPDQAATLILGATIGSGTTFTLSGPGIQGTTTIQIAGVPSAFWELRQRTRRYPLGWDVFVIDGAQVIGLPRSTQIDGGT